MKRKNGVIDDLCGQPDKLRVHENWPDSFLHVIICSLSIERAKIFEEPEKDGTDISTENDLMDSDTSNSYVFRVSGDHRDNFGHNLAKPDSK